MDQEYSDELQQILVSAKHPQTIELLEKALADAKNSQLNGTEKPAAKPSEKTEEEEEEEEEAVIKPYKKQKDTSLSMARITNYGWDQSDKFVKIYISDIQGVNELKTENIKTEFTQSFIKVELLEVCGKNYGLTINNLYAAIVPDRCTVKVKSGMVMISLLKTRKDSWEFLTAREKKLKDSKQKVPKLDADDKDDPSKGLMKMMQQMYEDGDDDMKRTIKKSWYESQEKKKTGMGMDGMGMEGMGMGMDM